MTKAEQRDAARLDSRFLRNLVEAAEILDTVAGVCRTADDRLRIEDIAGHLRNAAMFSPNTLTLMLRDARAASAASAAGKLPCPQFEAGKS